MKLIRVSIFIGLLLSLNAGCLPNIAPTGRISPVDATLVPIDTPATPPTMRVTRTNKPITPTSMESLITATEPLEKASDTPMPEAKSLTITIVYDNNPYDGRLKTAWGFAALVKYHDQSLLFDTGGDGPTLLQNMRILGIDPIQIENVMLSHAHGDHTGGLNALIQAGARPIVYVPPSFSNSFKRQVERYTSILEVSSKQAISEGLFTTGEMGRDILEQALVINTSQGLVVITGCAHPGIVAIVAQAREMFDDPVRLVLGGFHLSSKSKAEIDAILKDFRRLEVAKVAPCHCTGDHAIAMFAVEYGEDFIQAGVGKTIILAEGED